MSECDVVGRIRNVLIDKKFIKSIAERLQQARRENWSHENPTTYEDADLWERMDCDHRISWCDVFADSVLSKFPRPLPLTLSDLTDAARMHLSGTTQGREFSIGYRRFVYEILRQVNSWFRHKSAEIHIATFSGNSELGDQCVPITLWASKETDFVVYLVVHPTEFEDRVMIRFNGIGTKRAGDAIAKELQHVLPSLVTSLEHLADHYLVESIHASGQSEQLQDDAEYGFPIAMLGRGISSCADTLMSDEALAFFSTCLDAYFFTSKTRQKNALYHRLQNAICLLAEADLQEHGAISLSLCFSAIEALVCTKKEGIVDELSAHVATLLQPDSGQRSTAIRYIKKMYTIRCKVLHGEDINPKGGGSIRTVAAAVVAAVVEWNVHMQRMSTEADHRNFLDELKEARNSGRRMVGVPDALARCL